MVTALTVLSAAVAATGWSSGSVPAASAATPAQFLITPTAFDFGDVAVGTTSPAQTVTVTNEGTSSVVMNGAGGGTTLFGGSQDCQGKTLAPGASCHMSYAFTPTAAGAVTSTATGTWNGQAFSFSFAGNGGPPAAKFLITPTGFDFGDVGVGTTSPQQTVTVTNKSASSVVVSIAGGAAGQFGGSQDCQGKTLAPGASCHIFYAFTPTALGPAPGSTSGTINAQMFSFTFAGNGVPGVIRLFGNDRDATAVAISKSSFPTANSAKAVVLARSDPGQFADALVGAALAVAKQGPLLLTPGQSLDAGTLAEIQRVLPVGSTVYVLGGQAAVSDAVAAAITGDGYTVVRFGGSNRFQTATIVADQGLADPSTVLEATGLDFPDALAAGAAAPHVNGAVLLTNGASQAPETTAYLTAHPPTKRYAVGGQAAAADSSATAISGGDRYATAALVATMLFSAPTTFGAALGTNYPDALAGAAHIGSRGGPLLLVVGSGALPSSTTIYLNGVKATITGGFLYGGPAAVGDDVLGELNQAIK